MLTPQLRLVTSRIFCLNFSSVLGCHLVWPFLNVKPGGNTFPIALSVVIKFGLRLIDFLVHQLAVLLAASFRQNLAVLPLPFASSYRLIPWLTGIRRWSSYRGLSPHQFMPMLGVHKRLLSHLRGWDSQKCCAYFVCPKGGRWSYRKTPNSCFLIK